MPANVVKAPPPDATIRAFETESDLKVTRYLVGAHIMEPAAKANQSALFSPAIVLIWIAFTHYLVETYAGGWPDSVYNIFSGRGLAEWDPSNVLYGMTQWFRLGPTLVAPPIALLASFELRHRNKFEDEMTRAIGEEDMRDIKGYYQEDGVPRAGRTGFWVLEFDGRIIGCFGIDGRRPGVCLDSTVDYPVVDKKVETASLAIEPVVAEKDERYELRNRTPKKSVAVVAPVPAPLATLPPTYTDTLQLRRFATSLSFRPTGIEDDLLAYAANFAFTPKSAESPLVPARQLTISVRPSIQAGLVARLEKAGFKLADKKGTSAIDMDSWRDNPAAKGGIAAWTETLLTPIWPINLGWATYVLTREDWVKRTGAKE